MKINVKVGKYPRRGDERIVKKFVWFPTPYIIEDDFSFIVWIWLERITIKQKYVENIFGVPFWKTLYIVAEVNNG